MEQPGFFFGFWNPFRPAVLKSLLFPAHREALKAGEAEEERKNTLRIPYFAVYPPVKLRASVVCCHNSSGSGFLLTWPSREGTELEAKIPEKSLAS